MKVLVSILGVQKAMVGVIVLSFLALWATLGAQWRPKATKLDQRASKRRPKSAQRVPKTTKVGPKGAKVDQSRAKRRLKATKVGHKGVLEGPKGVRGVFLGRVG